MIGSQINFNNVPIQQNGLITPASRITSTQPLWCQSSTNSSTITWTLPDGTVLGPDSSPTNGAQVLTANGQLGLAPFPSTGVLPSGVYTCTVSGVNRLVMVGETTGNIDIQTQYYGIRIISFKQILEHLEWCLAPVI